MQTAIFVAECGALGWIWWGDLARLRFAASESDGWRIGDWLVSYRFGFVRRGLLGSPLLWVAERSGTPPQWVVFWLVAALYTLLFSCLVGLLWRRTLNAWVMALLLSPAALLFPINDSGGIGRKELLVLVVLAAFLWIRPAAGRLAGNVLAFLVGMAATLTHETFAFYTPYFLVAASAVGRPLHSWRRAPELYLVAGALLALGLVTGAGADLHGDEQCDALVAAGFDGTLCEGVLHFEITTASGAIADTLRHVREDRYLPGYLLASVLSVAPLVPPFVLHRRRLRWFIKGTSAAVLLSLPLFVIAVDWGRLIHIHAMCIALIATVALQQPHVAAAPREEVNRFFGTRSVALQVLTIVVIAWYLGGWSMRHCCDGNLQPGLLRFP